MNVAFAYFDAPDIINGVNSWLLDIVPRLNEAGLDTSLLAYSWCEPDDCFTSNVFRKKGFVVDHVSLKATLPNQFEDTTTIIRDQQIDTLVLGNLPVTLAATIFAGKNAVHVVHSLKDGCPEFLLHIAALYPGLLADNLKVVLITPSQFKIIPQNLSPKVVSLIPFGYSFNSCRKHFANAGVSLIYAGRLVEQTKKVISTAKLLDEAAAILPFEVACTFFGSGPDENQLQSVCASASYAKLAVVGMLAPDQVRDVMRQHDGLILLSDYEALPRSVLEAMSVGTVPIVSDIASMRAIITNCHDGFLVDTTANTLATALKALNNCATKSAISDNCLSTIQTKYSQSLEINRWLDLLTSFGNPNLPSRRRIVTALFETYRHEYGGKWKNILFRDAYRQLRTRLIYRATHVTD